MLRPYREREVRSPWISTGNGFDTDFPTEPVHPPTCDPAELLIIDGRVEARYMHFSLALHTEWLF